MLRGLVVLDEIQHRPEVFPYLRVLADRRPLPARFLVLGSASPELLRQSSESLAGRIAYYELPGLTIDEVGTDQCDRLWLRGGLPRSFLARSAQESFTWRRQFIRTFVGRDLPELGVRIPSDTMRRFWSMLAHWHGQTWNASEFSRSFGVTDKTVRNYLDLLTATFVVRQLRPWRENLRKRQVRSPKVFIRDSGLLHTLLGLQTREAVERHPKLGASWEGFAIENLVARLGAHDHEVYTWATHQGSEMDLLVVRGSQRRAFEIKRTSAPRTTRSMHIALQDLQLDHIDVVYAGDEVFPLAESIRALPLSRIWTEVEPLE